MARHLTSLFARVCNRVQDWDHSVILSSQQDDMEHARQFRRCFRIAWALSFIFCRIGLSLIAGVEIAQRSKSRRGTCISYALSTNHEPPRNFCASSLVVAFRPAG